MRLINISQATRFAAGGEHGTYLPAQYYDTHAAKWRDDMLAVFSHAGHRFIGAFVNDILVAYVYLVTVEDTWMFGAVKSQDKYLKHRPVDALYFTILSMASQEQSCKRVVNGGGDVERESLTYYKGEFLLKPVMVPYFTRALLPFDKVRDLYGRAARLGTKKRAEPNDAKAENK